MKRIITSFILSLICILAIAQNQKFIANYDVDKDPRGDTLRPQTEKAEDNLIFDASYSLIDSDGNSYDVVRIGNQIWMAENLKTAQYNDGTDIPLISDYKAWSELASPGYCWYRNDNGSYKADYGALYNGYSVSTGKLCPVGWHVPSIEEWMILVNFAGENLAGGNLKEIGTKYWMSPNFGATNTSGFTALPGGSRGGYGTYFDEGLRGHWWSISEGDSFSLRGISLASSNTKVTLSSDNKKSGLSVRCIKD
jgi:uncharacterized protein (TIGR02145 family)